MFNIHAMQWGSASISIPLNFQTGTVTARDGSANLTDANDAFVDTFVLSGAMEDIEYGVRLPALQTDGVTATSGTLTLSFQFQTSAAVSVGSAQSHAYTLGTAQYDTIRKALPYGADRVAITVTVSGGGNAGLAVLGWTIGGHRLSRAG